MIWQIGVMLLSTAGVLGATEQSELHIEPLTASSTLEERIIEQTASKELVKSVAPKKGSIEPFTAKITKNRVRLRLAPNLDSYVYKELEKDDTILVTAEVDDFFAVEPPKEIKGYVFRTYVLDGVIEGSNVNVRLEPDTTAPILCQLNTGDRVDGTIASNNKWLQIALPEDSRFYVAKEFVTKIGNKNFFTSLEAKKETLTRSLDDLHVAIEQELQKSFDEISVAPLASKLNHIISQNEDLPKHVERAKDLLLQIQQTYLQKSASRPAAQKPKPPVTVAQTESKQSSESAKPTSGNMIDWAQKEHELVEKALDSREISSEEQFYPNDLKKAVTLRGVLRSYDRFVRNRPGDYLLIDQKSGLPVACLYSTQCDLKNFIGQEVTLVASPRPNNHFAFHAYFVHKTQ